MAKILVIDDSPTEIHVISQMLLRGGYEVVTAENGEQGLVKAEQELPSLVIMDVVMPGMNGFQTTRKLTKNPKTQHIPVIMLTTKDQDTDREWGMRQGAKDYMVKPVDPEKLMGRVKELLG